MKFLCLFLAVSIFASLNVSGAEIADTHPLLGTWRVAVPGTDCLETYRFKSDGIKSSVSAAEKEQSKFEVSAEASSKGFYQFVDVVIQSNGEKDCTGGSTPVGDKATLFLRFNESKNKFQACLSESMEQCLGPFVRVGRGRK